MFDLSSLIVSAAYAQEAALQAADVPPSSGLMGFLPFILIFAVFWLLVIRPQQKKLAEQEKMIKALKKGDRVVTSGGMHGKIVKVDESGPTVVEIAEGVNVTIDTENILALETKPEAAPVEKDKKA
ncbi:MAG: preprotein translocase subunit YajC [Alphaproteobacteria bacterium]|nr:preprotein translocase subunit YajC [Alphaproteobacteria bacterium]